VKMNRIIQFQRIVLSSNLQDLAVALREYVGRTSHIPNNAVQKYR
jgi:hypothetical protein